MRVQAGQPLAPLSLGQMYSLASEGNVKALRAAVRRGLNIDITDRNGNTGLCHSIWKRNYTAYNAFHASGANPRHSCIQRIPTNRYDSFMSSWRVSEVTASPREAYNYFNEGEFMFSDSTYWIGGALLAGGIAALALGGGGGGGSSSYIYRDIFTPTDDSLGGYVGTMSPTSPQTYPYVPVKYDVQSGEVKTNTENFTLKNDSRTQVKNAETGEYEDQSLVDIINLNKSVLNNTKYIQAGMKASNGGIIQNGENNLVGAEDGTIIQLGDATAGMVALHNSQALNKNTININAKNAGLGMIASDKSTANNTGKINMTFTGNDAKHQINGMYADTSSTIVNNGTIEGESVIDGGGTMIGMHGQIINQESEPNPAAPTNLINSLNGDITLKATANDGTTSSKSLIGMGSFLEQDFLDGNKLIRRAGYVNLRNEGDINIDFYLNGSGAYGTDSGTLLNGTGGFVGMRADANTTALNAGNISVNIHPESATSVTNAQAGMQSVHGGTIQNNKNISVSGGTGGYGMLGIRGEGQNPEIDSRKPNITNSTGAVITVDSIDGFGMATYHGGTMANNGDINLISKGTGMHINAGTASNTGNITLGNSGQGMVIKRNPTGTEGGIYNASTAKITNSVSGTITIDKASGTQGMYIEDGTAQNDGEININNTEATPKDASYGIQAVDGTVINNGDINMNVLTPDADSYGIHSTNAKITNNTGAKIEFTYRGVGMYTDTGSNTNNGQIIMNAGGTGMSSNSGTINNNLNGSIVLDDTGTGILSTSGQVNNAGNITINGRNADASTGINAGKSVNNTGNITMTGSSMTGIEIGENGSVFNGGDINITSNANSIENYGIKGTSGTNTRINNTGNITFTGRGYAPSVEQGYGISITDGEAYNRGDIVFNNMYGIGMNTTSGVLRNYGQIDLNAGGSGVKGTTGKSFNETGALIHVSGTPTGFGSYGMQMESGTAWNDGTIIVEGSGREGDADRSFGIYVNAGNGVNNHVVNMISDNSYGMFDAGAGVITNKGGATINLSGNKSYGMTTTGGTAENLGVINVGTLAGDPATVTGGDNSVGMSATDGGTATNSGIINVNGTSGIGMLADGADSKVINETAGIIKLNGANGTAFKTKDGGEAINRGTIEHVGDDYVLFDTSEGGTSRNEGTVTSSGTGNKVMEVGEGGTIENSGSLTINGDDSYGMHSTGNGIADNYGHIIVNSNNSHGMYAKDNGTLTNHSPNGIIDVVGNQSNAMTSANADASLTNTGTINVSGTKSNGMVLQNGGGTSTATNSGTINISSSNASADDGAAMSGIAGILTNEASGKINISGKAHGMQGTATSSAGATVTNAGNITITGSGDGMRATAASSISGDIVNTLTNTGTIRLKNSGNGIFGQRADISNGEGASITLENGGYGINAGLSSGSNTITNNGSISVGSDATSTNLAYGIYTTSVYGVSNDAAGVISVLGANSAGIYADQGSVNNAGRITASGTSTTGIKSNAASVNNTGSIAVSGTNATGISSTTGNITNSGTITADGNGATIIQTANGIITNTGALIVSAENGKGLVSTGSGTIRNSGTIKVTGLNASGIVSSGSGSITNQAEIEVSGQGAAGIKVSGTAQAVNKKNDGSSIIVSGQGSSGMLSSGSDSKATNYGAIDVTGDNASGMHAEEGNVANEVEIIPAVTDDDGNVVTPEQRNPGIITVNNATASGMSAGNGTATNNSSIIVNQGTGMQVSGTGNAANKSTITVLGANANGMGASSGIATNSSGATIAIKDALANGVSGMLASGTGSVVNEGTISDTVAPSTSTNYLMHSTGGSGINKGVLNVSNKSYGMYAQGGTLTNQGSISIDYDAIGMVADGGTIINNGTFIREGTFNPASYLMYVKSGSGINNGTISDFAIDNFTYMKIDAGNLTNNGTIGVGDGDDGVLNMAAVEVNGGTFTNSNSGIINVLAGNSNAVKVNAGGIANNNGTINVNVGGAGGSNGIYVNGGTANNGGTINVNVGGTGGSNGIYVNGGTANNDGTINVNVGGAGGNNGILVNSGTATNKGHIIIGTMNDTGIITTGNSSDGMQTADAEIINDTTGIISGMGVSGCYPALMYVVGNSGKAINKGTLNAENYAKAIYLDAGSAENAAGGIINVKGNSSSMGMVASAGTATNNGTINVSGNGSKGMSSTGSGNVINGAGGTINVDNTTAYGMYTDVAGLAINRGTINVTQGYGMNIIASNEGTINVTASGAYGIYNAGALTSDTAGAAAITNKGNINSSAAGASGIYNTNSLTVGNNAYGIANSGNITASDGGKGVYVASGINVTGNNASGIYNTAGSLLNDSAITINGSYSSAIYATGGSVTNNASLTSSSGGTLVKLNGAANFTNNAGRSLTSTGTSTTEEHIGIIATNASGTIINAGNITVGSETSSLKASGIKVTSTSASTNIVNRGAINVKAKYYSSPSNYGIYLDGLGTAENARGATITMSGDEVYGMYATGGGTATNNGTININDTIGADISYGMYASNGSKVINNGTIKLTGTEAELIGMYATGTGSSIENNGNIILNGTSMVGATCTPSDTSGCGQYIKVADGATFTNNAAVVSSTALNFSLLSSDGSGSILLGRGGSFEAPEIEGDIIAAANIVEGEQKDQYVNEDSFIGEDTGIQVSSGSYMFDAALKTNEDGNTDVVMNRKAFSEIVDNGEIASYLENNYIIRHSLYDSLRAAGDAGSFATATAEGLGLNLIPNFAKQNLDVVKSVDRQITNALFANNDQKDMRAMVGYDFFNREQDGEGILSGYEDQASSVYGIFDKKYDNALRYGLGISFTDYDSDYDNGSTREEAITQILGLLSFNNNEYSFVAAPRFGMGFGKYERYAGGEKYKADTRNYYYGITNQGRKEIDMGSFALEPTAELNILGVYQDSTRENGMLKVNSSNNLSVEGGIGLYAKKEYEFDNEDVLKLRAGGTYYHEFNNPYQAAKASIDGLSGSYHMDSYDTQRDRGVLSARIDYKHEEFDFYAQANKYLEEDAGWSLNAGIGYRF